MQSSKNAVAVATEAVANIGASAKSGLDKTKAVVEEKVEKLTARQPEEKETAERLKVSKVRDAETRKREAMEQNAAATAQVRAAGHGVGGPVEVPTAQSHGPPGGIPGQAEIPNQEAVGPNAAAAGPVEVTAAQSHGPPGGIPGQVEIRSREAVEPNAAVRDQARAGVPAEVAAAQNKGPPGRIPGQVESGAVGSRLIGRETGSGRPSAAHNPRAGSA